MQKFTQDTRIESCAILHSHYQDEPCLIKFYWGSMQDFPEYKLGETIRWSDFSVGDQNMDDIVYARGFIDGAHHIPVLIHIKDNKIAAVHFHADYSAEKKDGYSYYRENATLFYTDQWLPWLNMPGRNYIRSFRIKRPDKSELVPTKKLCCASGYQPSDAYLELLG